MKPFQKLWCIGLMSLAPVSWAKTNVVTLAGRSVLAHAPLDASPTPPLLIVLHGAGGTPAQIEALTGFSSIADREKFVVLYPEGVNRHWNDGRNVPGVDSDDVGFISALIEEAIRKWKVNQARVFVAGLSNGGTMAYRLACELSDKIVAAASVAGSMALPVFQTCRPSKPVSIFAVNGTSDPIIPFAGGEIRFGKSGGRGVVTGAFTSRDLWAQLNGCISNNGEVPLPDADRDGLQSVKSIRSNCKLNTRVEAVFVNGGGHKYPGVSNGFGPYIDSALGRTTYDFHASEAIWQFLRALPLRATRSEIETLVRQAFQTYCGQPPAPGSRSLADWVSHVLTHPFHNVADLVRFLMISYLANPGTAETIVGQVFADLTGAPTSPASTRYWAGVVRETVGPMIN